MHPEFRNAPDALVERALDDASALTPANIWGTLREKGIRLRAARALALMPFARGLELADDDGATIYDRELDDMIRVVVASRIMI